jgi:acyl carrier protein
MDERTLCQLLDDLFELEPGTLSGESVIQDIPGWDSLSLLMLISCLDEAAGVTLGPDAIGRCRSIGDLAAMLGDQIRGNSRAA